MHHKVPLCPFLPEKGPNRVNDGYFCKGKMLDLFNPLPDGNDKLNVTQNFKVVFHRTENIVGKEENAGNQHFLLFPQCFQKALSSSASKVIIVW